MASSENTTAELVGSLIGTLISVPLFWLCWTYYGLGSQYFSFLPEHYHQIPLGHCFGLYVIFGIIQSLFFRFRVIIKHAKD